MKTSTPRRKKYRGDVKGDQPRLKLRSCLGSECKNEIKARYPGLCQACKKRLGQSWESPVPEYNGPGGY